MKGLEMGAVSTLVVYENFTINRFELRNPQSEEITVLLLTPQQEEDPSYFHTEDGAELEVAEKMQLTEWFAENYKKFGCILEFVTDRSQEGTQFVKGFGGIGGLLRWKVDFAAMEELSDDEADGEDMW
jgi:peptide chain release factor subunit 1